MSEVTPTGERGKAKENLRNLLAESATFQTDIGASGTPQQKIDAAKLKIHKTALLYDELETGGFDWPFMLLCSTGNDTNEQIGSNHFAVGGDIELVIKREISAGYQAAGQEANAEVEFENFYETIMAEVMALGQTAGYFAMNSWDIIDGPARYEPGSEQQYIYGVRILINWGLSE